MRPMMKHKPKLAVFILIAVLCAAFSLYLALLTPNRFGAYHDDAIYVSTAKALATGQGYRLINLPYEPAQTKYPPFYPFVLSLIWRIYPQFPENLSAMMLLSVVATLGFLLLSWRYLVGLNYATKWQALVVVGLSALNWRTMILATGIYSEMTYAALSIAALYLAEKYEKDHTPWIAAAALGVLMGMAFLTRTSGVALPMAVGSYFTLRRQWRKALLAVAVIAVFALGWIGWCYANRTTVEGVTVAYYTSYLGHLNEIINDLQMINHTSRLLAFLNIVLENFIGGILVSLPLVCSGLNYGSAPSLGGHWAVALVFISLVFLLTMVGLLRHLSKGLRLLHVYVVLYLAIHLFWLPNVSYDRFLMPILPFLLFFILSELFLLVSLVREEFRSHTQVVRKVAASFVGLILLVLAGLTLYNYGSGVGWSLASLKMSNSRAAEDAEAIGWIKTHTGPADVLICYRDPMYYLYTGRRATRSFPMKAGVSWGQGQSDANDLRKLILRIITEANGRYVVLTSSDFEFEEQPDLQRREFKGFLLEHPHAFVPVFESNDGRAAIYFVELQRAMLPF